MHNRMRDLTKTFTDHPHQAGESYLGHLWFTLCMAARFFYLGIVLVIHGLLPFLFTHTASMHIEGIYLTMKIRASKSKPSDSAHYQGMGI